MEDEAVITHIDALIAEEHHLRDHAAGGDPLPEADRARLAQLEERLDQLWDLLRRRRALRSAGQDPDAAAVRDTEVVEHYQQ